MDLVSALEKPSQSVGEVNLTAPAAGYSGRVRWLAIVVALLAVTAAAGCGGERAEEEVAPRETVTQPPAQTSNREAAPPLSGVTLDGDAIAIGDFRGRPVLINVWSSW